MIEMMQAINRMRHERQVAIVLVERKYDLALAHSERCVAIDQGAVVYVGASRELLGAKTSIDQLLGVDA